MKRGEPNPRPKLGEALISRQPQAPRAAYSPPRLEPLGSLTEITLGSVGTFPESGGGFSSFG